MRTTWMKGDSQGSDTEDDSVAECDEICQNVIFNDDEAAHLDGAYLYKIPLFNSYHVIYLEAGEAAQLSDTDDVTALSIASE